MQVYNHNESAVTDLELIILRLRPSQNFHIGFLKSSGTTGTTVPHPAWWDMMDMMGMKLWADHDVETSLQSHSHGWPWLRAFAAACHGACRSTGWSCGVRFRNEFQWYLMHLRHLDEFSLLNDLQNLNEMFGKDAFANTFQIAVVSLLWVAPWTRRVGCWPLHFWHWPRGTAPGMQGKRVLCRTSWNSNVKPTSAVLFLGTNMIQQYSVCIPCILPAESRIRTGLFFLSAPASGPRREMVVARHDSHRRWDWASDVASQHL